MSKNIEAALRTNVTGFTTSKYVTKQQRKVVVFVNYYKLH